MGRAKTRRTARCAKPDVVLAHRDVATPVIADVVRVEPTPKQLAPMPPANLSPGLDFRWQAADAAVVGSAHLRASPPKPCQDAALADADGRPLVVLADGAGIAAVSHVGATIVIAAVRRLCRTLDSDIGAALDEEGDPTGIAEAIAHRIVAHARGTLDDLADAHLRNAEDFRCTLLVWLAGHRRALWVKVGDGVLVAEADREIRCVGPIGKGEFANQTSFIGPRLADGQWAWGEIDATRLTGLAAMSDGAAERLIAHDAGLVSPAIGKLLRGAAEARVSRREIFGLLSEAEFWIGTSGDDKSLALLARTQQAV